MVLFDRRVLNSLMAVLFDLKQEQPHQCVTGMLVTTSSSWLKKEVMDVALGQLVVCV